MCCKPGVRQNAVHTKLQNNTTKDTPPNVTNVSRVQTSLPPNYQNFFDNVFESNKQSRTSSMLPNAFNNTPPSIVVHQRPSNPSTPLSSTNKQQFTFASPIAKQSKSSPMFHKEVSKNLQSKNTPSPVIPNYTNRVNSQPDSGINMMNDTLDDSASIASDLPSAVDYLTNLGIPAISQTSSSHTLYEPPKQRHDIAKV